jgi:ubiquitin C-terminal hydrolase
MCYVADRSAKFCQYSLCGVVMHEGAIEGGHYWAYIKRNGKWYEADDEEVEEKKAC